MFIYQLVDFISMDYVSIFNKIKESYEKENPYPYKDNNLREEMLKNHYYKGSLNDIINQLTEIFNKKQLCTSDLIKLAFHPPRLIRTVIDYKTENPRAKNIEEVLRQVINLGLKIYQRKNRVIDDLNKFKKIIEECAGLLLKELKQDSDAGTCSSMNPSYTISSSKELLGNINSSDVLFISLAHGGVAAGMDIYLRYLGLSKSENSAFYVTRLSLDKKNDYKPKLSEGEIIYLKGLSKDKSIIIFDEDVYYFDTMRVAYKYFSNIFSSKDISALVSLNSCERLQDIMKGVYHFIPRNILEKMR